jgi:hypothetical protein
MARSIVLALALLVIAACGGGKTGVYKHDYAGSITLTIVNASPRPIEQILIHPVTMPERGTSWTQPLAPGASTSVRIAEGHYELIAISAERRIDEKTRETPEAMSMLEINKDQKLVFHDQGQTVAGLEAMGTLGITFMITAAPEGGSTEPSTDPVP